MEPCKSRNARKALNPFTASQGRVRRVGPPRRVVPLSSPLLGRGFGAQDPITQPLEPILFPKLRIYFADFPYLHCST